LGFGARGAAWASLISVSIASIIFRYYAYKITRSRPNPAVLKHIIAASIMGFVLHIINSIFAHINIINLLLMGIVGISIYFVLLILLKEFNKNDFNYLISFLNLKSLNNYAKKEIKDKYQD